MAEQIFSGDPGSLTTGNYVGPTFGNDTGMQSGAAPVPVDDEANQGAYGEKVGGEGSDDFAGGAQHQQNAAQPGATGVAGGGGDGSTGIVGEIING